MNNKQDDASASWSFKKQCPVIIMTKICRHKQRNGKRRSDPYACTYVFRMKTPSHCIAFNFILLLVTMNIFIFFYFCFVSSFVLRARITYTPQSQASNCKGIWSVTILFYFIFFKTLRERNINSLAQIDKLQSLIHWIPSDQFLPTEHRTFFLLSWNSSSFPPLHPQYKQQDKNPVLVMLKRKGGIPWYSFLPGHVFIVNIVCLYQLIMCSRYALLLWWPYREACLVQGIFPIRSFFPSFTSSNSTFNLFT